MGYPLFLARKMTLGSDQRRSSPAVKVSVTAVALSVTVMILAVAIVLGFKREIRSKVRGFNSDLTLFADANSGSDTNLSELTPLFKNALLATPGVRSAELSVSSPAILKTPGDFKGIYLKTAISPQTRSFLKDNLESGGLPDAFKGNSDIIISRRIADQLNLKSGDFIETYFFTDNIRVRKLRIAGIYNSHFEAYDDLFVYGPKELLDEISGLLPYEGTSILISCDDFENIAETGRNVRQTMFECLADGRTDRIYSVQTAQEAGAGYFNWLSMLDVNVVVILTLMMAVGCVTLISGMLIIILDKRRFIGTLKAIGTPTRRLRRIFIYLAIRVALTGLLIGDLIGIGLLFIQDKTHIVPLDPESYYMDFVPVEISLESILLINAGVLIISYLVLILPSRFIARISPAETMRDSE